MTGSEADPVEAYGVFVDTRVHEPRPYTIQWAGERCGIRFEEDLSLVTFVHYEHARPS
jgi:hypothetical protein